MADDVDQRGPAAQHIAVAKVLARLVLLDHQAQRIERARRAAGMAGGDGARVTGGDPADERERRRRRATPASGCGRGACARRLDQFFGADARHALVALRVEQRDEVPVRQADELGGVLDSDEALVERRSLRSAPLRRWSCPSPLPRWRRSSSSRAPRAGKTRPVLAACKSKSCASRGDARDRATSVRANNPPAASVAIVGANYDGRRIVRLSVAAAPPGDGTPGGAGRREASSAQRAFGSDILPDIAAPSVAMPSSRAKSVRGHHATTSPLAFDAGFARTVDHDFRRPRVARGSPIGASITRSVLSPARLTAAP